VASAWRVLDAVAEKYTGYAMEPGELTRPLLVEVPFTLRETPAPLAG